MKFLNRGERGNDDILSIVLHNSTTWCHMMAILPSFDSQRNRPSTNTYSVSVLRMINLSLKAQVKEGVKIWSVKNRDVMKETSVSN